MEKSSSIISKIEQERESFRKENKELNKRLIDMNK